MPQVVPEKYLDEKTIFHLNPSGRFVIGGPHGDAGLTGRKVCPLNIGRQVQVKVVLLRCTLRWLQMFAQSHQGPPRPSSQAVLLSYR